MFTDLAYSFMAGVAYRGSAGFAMMGPDELKGQRWTFVKRWIKELNDHRAAAINSLKE